MKLNDTRVQLKREKQEAARLFLGKLETESTKGMTDEERQEGVNVMLNDLLSLAHNNDSTAAAWALEVITELSYQLEQFENNFG